MSDKSNITVVQDSIVYAILLNVYACVVGTKLFKRSSPWLPVM